MSAARDKILAAAGKFRPVKVEIEGIDGGLHVRPMSIAGVARFQKACAVDQTAGMIAVIIECLCDEDGVRILNADDASTVAEWPANVITALVELTTKHTGLGEKTAAGDAEGN